MENGSRAGAERREGGEEWNEGRAKRLQTLTETHMWAPAGHREPDTISVILYRAVGLSSENRVAWEGPGPRPRSSGRRGHVII